MSDFSDKKTNFTDFYNPKMKKAVMNFLNHYCFKQLFSGGIEPPTSAEEALVISI